MEVACVAQVVDENNIAAPQKDIDQSVHDCWRGLAARRSITKEQEHVAQDGDATNNILALEVDKTHTHDTRDNVVCQGIRCADDAVGNHKECHRAGLREVWVDVHTFGHFGKNCRTKIIVNVCHDELPGKIQVLGFDLRRRIVKINLTD